jgi:type I restriction enzyme S subunit
MTTTSTYAKAKLGSVCELLAGYAWNSDGFNSDGDGLPIIRIQNVANDNGKDFVYWNGSYDPRFLIELGDILLSLSGSFRAEKWSGPKALLNQRVVKLCVRPGLDENWLLTCLRQKLGQIERMGRHALVNNVSLGDLKNLEIPLPPLPEQRRIAAILDKADAIRRKREEGIRLTEELLRSTFLEMFGDPATNPKGWAIKPFGELARNEDGRRKPVKEADRAERHGEYPYYGASGIIDYVDEFLFNERTLLIAEDGANLLARATPIAFIADGKYWVNNHAHVVSDNGKADLDYLRFSLNLRRLDDFVTGSAQPKLNQASLNRISIPVPPLPAQRKFAEVVRKLNELRKRRQTAVNEATSLFGSLVQRSFRGEL